MKIFKHNIIWGVILLSMSFSGCSDRTVSTRTATADRDAVVTDKQPLVSDLRSLVPGIGKTPIVRLKDVNISLGGEVDLATKQLDFSYALKNKLNSSRQISLVQPAKPKDRRELTLAARGEKVEAFKGNIQITRLSQATQQAVFRPYLLGTIDTRKDKPLLARYNTDVKIRLPAGARLVKSNVGLKKLNASEYRWKVEAAPMLPPVHLWYTTATEDISASMDLVKGETVIVNINVKNNARTAARNLRLLTRFPVGKYEPVLEESDGEFTIEQGVMYIWKANITSLAGGASSQLRLKLKNLGNDAFPKIQEVAIHNKNGDLVAVAE